MPSPGIIGAIAIGALHFWQIGPESRRLTQLVMIEFEP
jgi:hypothetical protein